MEVTFKIKVKMPTGVEVRDGNRRDQGRGEQRERVLGKTTGMAEMGEGMGMGGNLRGTRNLGQ